MPLTSTCVRSDNEETDSEGEEIDDESDPSYCCPNTDDNSGDESDDCVYKYFKDAVRVLLHKLGIPSHPLEIIYLLAT